MLDWIFQMRDPITAAFVTMFLVIVVLGILEKVVFRDDEDE